MKAAVEILNRRDTNNKYERHASMFHVESTDTPGVVTAVDHDAAHGPNSPSRDTSTGCRQFYRHAAALVIMKHNIYKVVFLRMLLSYCTGIATEKDLSYGASAITAQGAGYTPHGPFRRQAARQTRRCRAASRTRSTTRHPSPRAAAVAARAARRAPAPRRPCAGCR